MLLHQGNVVTKFDIYRIEFYRYINASTYITNASTPDDTRKNALSGNLDKESICTHFFFRKTADLPMMLILIDFTHIDHWFIPIVYLFSFIPHKTSLFYEEISTKKNIVVISHHVICKPWLYTYLVDAPQQNYCVSSNSPSKSPIRLSWLFSSPFYIHIVIRYIPYFLAHLQCYSCHISHISHYNLYLTHFHSQSLNQSQKQKTKPTTIQSSHQHTIIKNDQSIHHCIIMFINPCYIYVYK